MTGHIRIIAGEWRGRKLQVPDKQGLRPTPSRVREMLFNWLSGSISGSRCLDLFAGSGALGIEAASRGAKQVTLVEKDYQITQGLTQQIHIFDPNIKHINVIAANALTFLKTPTTPFDIVFLDPPFGADLLQPCYTLLENGGWLSDQAYIYIEVERRLKELQLPETWQIIRHKEIGQVAVFLVRSEVLL